MTKTSDFSKNLKVLCSRVRSVSALCRELGLNRQQFARYLSGASRPYQFNLTRIAAYFSIPSSDLNLPHGAFLALHSTTRSGSKNARSSLINETLDAPAGHVEQIRPYVGYYFVYLQSPTEPTRLLKSLVQLYIDGDRFVSKWEESFKRVADGSFQTSRYEGVVRYLNGYLFIVDIETSVRDTVLETILRVPYRRKADVLTGLTMGMTTGRRRLPFASITAFNFLGKSIDWASRRRQCGFYDMSSKHIDPVVRNVFNRQAISHIYPKVLDDL